MKWLSVVVIVLAVVSVSFFVVFSFHASSEIQKDVKLYLDSGNGELPFSINANYHMEDVYNLLKFFRVLTAVLVILVFYVFSFVNRNTVKYASFALFVIVFLAAIVPWNLLFELFHKVFFPQGNYSFPANSLLIQTYPNVFFMTFAIVWGLLIAVMAFVSLYFSKRIPLDK